MEIFGIRRRFRDMLRNAREAEQLRVQLAGVTTAALGWSKGNEAKQGQYGWSPAYQDVLSLRQAWEKLWERYAPMPGLSRKIRYVAVARCGFCGQVIWSTSIQSDDVIVLPAGKEGETIRVSTDVRADLMVRVRVIREPQGQLMLEGIHECSAVRGLD